MESLGDDELGYIFDKIHDVHDRKSFYQVSKQFLKTACTRLRELNISCADLLKYLLTASPNMNIFTCSQLISNTYMELLARSCPNILHLRLGSQQEGDFEFDFDDDGLCAVANACSRLYEVCLSCRLNIGDVGVDLLVSSCKDLTYLNLNGCASVTDESFKSVGESNSLRHLSLQGCLISDSGLEYMAKGNLKNNLESLYLDKCDKISDHGISYLRQMVNLTKLTLSMSGISITDSGILAVSQIPKIKILDLSWLINITDISLSHIAKNCLKLNVLEMEGCNIITGKGVRSFAHHPTLENLSMYSCHNISWKAVKSIALTCTTLRVFRLSRKIQKPGPKAGKREVNIGGKWCLIDWK